MKQYDVYLFDLYGTLIDIRTNERKFSFWKHFCEFLRENGANAYPRKIEKEYHSLVATLAQELSAQLGTDQVEIDLYEAFARLWQSHGIQADSTLINATAKAFRSYSLEKLTLLPQVGMTLRELKARGKQIYLLSNAQTLFTDPEVEHLGLKPYFDAIFYSSDIRYKKPSAAFFEAPFKRYAIDRKNCVMVGNDYRDDVLGATAFGIDSVYMETAQSGPVSGPLPASCTRIKKLSDLLS